MITIADKPKNAASIESLIWDDLIELERGLLTKHLKGVLLSQLKMCYEHIQSDDLRKAYDLVYKKHIGNGSS